MGTSFLQIREGTELIKVNDEKHKYINTKYKKIPQKMFDYKCDVDLKVGTEQFHAHKDVLSEASVYFAAMFGHDMVERKSDVVELHDISPTGFTALLEYFYHGYITVDSDNIEDILEAARFFHVEWLIDIACDFLVRKLSIENYYNVLHLADKYVLGDLSADIFKHVGQHFQILSKQEKFMMLSWDLLYQLLSVDYYINASEKEILQLVLKWISHDEEERGQHLIPLFKQIRFPLLTLDDLDNLPESVTNCEELKDLIKNAQESYTNATLMCLEDSTMASQRGSQPVIALVAPYENATAEDLDCDFIHYKVPGEKAVLTYPLDSFVLETIVEYANMASIGNFLFVFGGYDRLYRSSERVYRYDPSNFSWMEVTPMNQPRVNFGSCSTNDALFAVAGVDHVVMEDGEETDLLLNSAETYLAKENRWQSLPPLPYHCYNCAVAKCGDKLYVSGGVSDNPQDEIPVKFLNELTLGNETWNERQHMLNSRHDHNMVSYNDKLFVFGGKTSSNSMNFTDCFINEMYDPETDQWSEITQTPRMYGRLAHSTAWLNNKLYMLGGKIDHRFLFAYDFEKEEMTSSEQVGESCVALAQLKVGIPQIIS